MPAENVMTPCKLFDEEHSVGNFMSVKPCTPKPKNKCTLLLIGPIKTDFTGSLDLSVWLNGLKETEQGGFNFFFFFFYRCHVDGCRGLIHDQDAALTNKGSGEAEELPLAHAEVLSSFGYHRICTEFKIRLYCTIAPWLPKQSIYHHKDY